MTTPSQPAARNDSLFASETITGLRAAMDEATCAASLAAPSDMVAMARLSTCAHVARAVEASDAGRMDEARRLLDEALARTDDLRLLFLGYQFCFRLGEYDAAERLIHRRLVVAGPDSADAARAWNNLGLLYHFRADLGGAETMLRRALEIDRRIGNEEGVARDLGNLSLVPESRGDLKTAERLNRESLAIAERIGAASIVASRLCNLGEIMLARGHREQARPLLKRAAAAYGALGIEKHRALCERHLAEIERSGGEK